MPVLGICLGAQLIATALGAKVRKNPVKEIGWYDVTPTKEGEDDPLFGCFNGTQQIFQWHGDTFDIPHGAVALASSSECANQAFRFGERTYGLQFHLEVDEPLIQRWLKTPVHIREMEREGDHISTEKILADTKLYMQQSAQLGDQLFSEYIRLFSSKVRRVAMPSR